MASTQTTSKIVLLLLGAAFYDRGCLPPTRPPSAGEQMRTDKKLKISWHETLMALALLPHWARFIHWAFICTEAAGIYIKYSQSGVAPPLPPTFIVGSAVLITGASIRLRCFSELGRHFTLAMSVRDNHTLVTSGPYGLVRHPAYTGGLLQLLGAGLVVLGAGSWWSQTGYATPWGVFLAGNFMVCVAVFGYACLRGAKEDEYLAKNFGEQWKSWAQRVPCRYIPGIC
ncbi:hypothetical protein B0H15DRAFT_797816 [Mycena belliarum]|uniref:Protein-S-isoprenylcysteine O-methyltransferase n=1 Tax=Mycena belliarum TaxID=1033014 RepID=A0AAD6XUP6_9AGAR|nr:hypothetical protein B0H15DRAFT_797816 [Mycena belliae]